MVKYVVIKDWDGGNKMNIFLEARNERFDRGKVRPSFEFWLSETAGEVAMKKKGSDEIYCFDYREFLALAKMFKEVHSGDPETS